MKCCEPGCEASIARGDPLFRQNPKGQAGVWACRRHNKADIDPVVNTVVSAVREGQKP